MTDAGAEPMLSRMVFAMAALAGAFGITMGFCFVAYWLGQATPPRWHVSLVVSALAAAGLIYATALAGALGFLTALLCLIGGGVLAGLFRAGLEELSIWTYVAKGLARSGSRRPLAVDLRETSDELERAKAKLRAKLGDDG